MQIWRMRPDGSGAEQVTSDDFNNWTPHPSPDGKSIVIVSYDKDVKGHPTDKDIALRILNISDGKIRVLVNLVGGAGSDNVPNWAPDGTHLAFVSFQMLPGGMLIRTSDERLNMRAVSLKRRPPWVGILGIPCVRRGRWLNSSGAVTLRNHGLAGSIAARPSFRRAFPIEFGTAHVSG